MPRKRGGWRRAIALTIALAAALTAVAVWSQRDRPAKNFGVVEAGKVYRSGRLTPESLRRVVDEYGVKTIVDLGGHLPGSEGDKAEERAAAEAGVRRVVLRMEGDGTGDPNNYVKALRILADPANQPALVHCAAGAQRTGAAVALYRHVVEGRPFLEVYPETWEYGHRPAKNWRFLAYLADWADEIKKAYEEGGEIEGQGAEGAAP